MTRLATLTILGLVIAHAPATHAQELVLNSGDIVTVSGRGTTNSNPTGTPVNAATTSYTTAGGSNSNGIYAAVETDGTAAFTLGTGGTLANVVGNGNSALYANGSGSINITGGIMSAPNDSGIDLRYRGTGIITISGGTFTAGRYGSGLLDIGTGLVSISGGVFSAGDGGYALNATNSGSITVTGGTFTAGQGGYDLYAGQGSPIVLYGSFIDPMGKALMPGETESLSSGSGSFFGTLQNNSVGQTFTYDMLLGGITLNDVAPAPEPSAFVGLGIGLLGLAVLTLRARRRIRA